jgi:hypothetical protein
MRSDPQRKDMGRAVAKNFVVEEWRPTTRAKALWFGAMMTFGALGGLLSGIYRSDNPQTRADFALAGALIFFVLVVLPCVQYVLIRKVAKASPTPNSFNDPQMSAFGYWRTIGHKLPRITFALICGVPAMAVWLLLPLYLLFVPRPMWGFSLVALTIAIGVFSKELWYSALVLSKPEGTFVEDPSGGGVRFYYPTSCCEQCNTDHYGSEERGKTK